MSKSLFNEHMRMLKDAGYSAVGLQEICDLYYEERLLPEKAVVVLLDGSRDTRINAAPVIRELGLRATMMLDVRAMKHKDRSFINWHDVKTMAKRPQWDFGLVAERPSDVRQQLEYIRDRFADVRVCGVCGPADLAGCSTLVNERLLILPERDGDGYNSATTDPSCLSLLKVDPQQRHDDVAHILSRVFSPIAEVKDEFVEDTVSSNWTSTCGDADVTDDVLELSARPFKCSADAWFVGAYDWADVDLAVRFKVAGGRQFWTYVRFKDENNYVRLGCDGGRLCLQQKTVGMRLEHLKVADFDSDFSQFHDLRLIVRGHHAIAHLDGRKLSVRPLRLDDSLVSGKVGFAVWDPVCGVARCEIDSTSVRKLPCLALVGMNSYEDVSRAIAEHSDYLSYICPNGLGLEDRGWADHERFLISTAYNEHEFTPTVVLGEDELASNDPDILADTLSDLVGKYRLDGLHLDCRSSQDEESITALAEVLGSLRTKLPESTLLLSPPPQCYPICEGLVDTTDAFVLRSENRGCALLDRATLRLRRKTLLRVETDEPWAFIENLTSVSNTKSMIHSVNDAVYIVRNYELKGIALCEE